MNKIAFQTGEACSLYGVDGGYKLLKECGFDAVDVGLYGLTPYRDVVDNKLNEALMRGDVSVFTPWKEAAEKYGLDNYQAHAIMPCYIPEEVCAGANDRIIEILKNTVRGCNHIGCRNLVVHPFFGDYFHQMDKKTEWKFNIEQYSKLIPVAKEYGVKILLENMFTAFKRRIYAAICSDITEACNYIDTLNGIAGTKQFGFCLDTGHLLLVGVDIKNAMIQLGDRIEAFHMHDNDGRDDLHVSPYMGVLDWDRFIEGLKAIKFDKTISFEAGQIWDRVDREMVPSLLRFTAECGRMFARRAAQ